MCGFCFFDSQSEKIPARGRDKKCFLSEKVVFGCNYALVLLISVYFFAAVRACNGYPVRRILICKRVDIGAYDLAVLRLCLFYFGRVAVFIVRVLAFIQYTVRVEHNELYKSAVFGIFIIVDDFVRAVGIFAGLRFANDIVSAVVFVSKRFDDAVVGLLFFCETTAAVI